MYTQLHIQTHSYMLIVWKFNSTTKNKENNKQNQSKFKWCTSKDFQSGFIVFQFTSRNKNVPHCTNYFQVSGFGR